MTDKQQDAKTEAQGVEDVLWRIENEAGQFIDEKGMIYLRYLGDLLKAALSTPASHDAQQPAAFLTLSEASEGSEWPEAPLQLTEVGRKLPHGTHALYAQQPETEQSIKADAYDMIAEALESRGVRVSSIVDHVTGLIAQQPAVVGVTADDLGNVLLVAGRHLRGYISKASFSSVADKWAAEGCIDIMERAIALTPAAPPGAQKEGNGNG